MLIVGNAELEQRVLSVFVESKLCLPDAVVRVRRRCCLVSSVRSFCPAVTLHSTRSVMPSTA